MMRWFRDLSISLKIQLILFLALALPAAIFLFLATGYSNALLTESGRSRIDEETFLVQQRITHIEEDLSAAANLFKNTPGLLDAIVSNDRDGLRTLALAASASLEVDDFDVFDAQGNRLVDTFEAGEEEDPEDAIIAQTLLGVQQVTLYEALQEGGLALRSVATRVIRNAQGETIGGFTLTRNIDDAFLTQLNYERDGVELGLILDGQLVAASLAAGSDGPQRQISGDFAVQPELFAAAMSGDIARNSETVFSQSGTPFVEAFVPVQGLDDLRPSAALVVRVNMQTIADFQKVLVTAATILAVVIALGFMAIMGTLLNFTVSRRIAALTSAAARIGAGNYGERVNLTGRDQLGTLGHVMNELAGDIQKRQADLQAANETLERRVRERTREAEGARRIAEENNRLKSEFLATMSHELRTPLNAIEGFTSIIRNRMGGADFNEKTGRYIERIEANSKRLLGLVNDFLDISRIESGRLQLASLPFSPAEAAQKWASQIGVLADKKGIAFDLTLDPDLPDQIVGDEEAVSKMALNLLSNAIKFTEQGKVSLDVRATGSSGWQITVRDTGIGIPPHAREYIFDEFRQVDQTSSRKYGGTGLGLTIVQKLARAMGGSVVVESEVGRGSVFTLTLPYEVAQAEAIPA
ncbi:MAG: HAMP domain-containing protein [Anaerolineae bacterium]|nr:HAMP domain-containing protein [Anaerolineae bacterium]